MHVKVVRLHASATAAQRADFEYTHVESDEGQLLHKASMVARDHRRAVDAKPGAGRERYKKGVRWAIIDEDKAGNGFRYDQVYEILLNADGRPIERDEATLVVPDGVQDLTVLLPRLGGVRAKGDLLLDQCEGHGEALALEES